MDKKGLSEVITTILLVLIGIIAVGLIAAFLLPSIRDKLKQSSSCFDLRDHVSLVEESSCSNSTNTKLMIERTAENLDIKGFAIGLVSNGEVKRYDIINGTTLANAYMLDGSSILIIPGAGGAKTYILPGSSTGINLAALKPDNGVCDAVYYDVKGC